LQKIVGIGEMIISNNLEDSIKTFALASCIGVIVYTPRRKIGGMIHIALPVPPNVLEGNSRSCYYVSTGVPQIINQICSRYDCLEGELVIRVFGGANSIRKDDMFNIGRKNIETVRNILRKMNLKFDDSETGQCISRTIELEISSGKVSIYSQQMKI
jgi:chemotaxis protein CheD